MADNNEEVRVQCLSYHPFLSRSFSFDSIEEFKRLRERVFVSFHGKNPAQLAAASKQARERL
jgi:hypothetical protein